MDVFYLAIAYLATMLNWASLDAFRVSRYRPVPAVRVVAEREERAATPAT